MAQAKASPRKTTRNVTLKLTEGEADLVLALTAMAGGHPSKSPRKYARRIAAALRKALGYNETETDAWHLGLGHVEFFNYGDHPDISLAERALAVLGSDGYQLASDYYGDRAVETFILELAGTYARLKEAEVPGGVS